MVAAAALGVALGLRQLFIGRIRVLCDDVPGMDEAGDVG